MHDAPKQALPPTISLNRSRSLTWFAFYSSPSLATLRCRFGSLFFLNASSLESAGHPVISFVAGILVHKTVNRLQGKLRCPGLCKRGRVIDRKFVVDGISIHARETFN